MKRKAAQYLDNHFLLAAMAASLLLSLWSVWLSPRVNTDAILYLIAADKLLTSGLSASLEIYNWPFFQIAFAAIHNITGLSLLLSARLVMTGCYLALTAGFCLVLKELGGDRKTQWFALLVILCHPVVNEFRSNLVRDPGMIGFMLLALWQQIRFANTSHWRHSLWWAINMAVAVLFRKEAVLVALLAPAAMLLLTGFDYRTKLLLSAKMLAAPALAITAGLALLAATGLNISPTDEIAFLSGSLNRIGGNLQTITELLSTQVLGEFSRQDGALALFSIMLTLTLAGIARAISLPYLAPLAMAWLGRAPIRIDTNIRIVWLYGLVVFAYLLAFVIAERFTTTRYGLPLAILLLLPLPFYLRHWWYGATRPKLARALIVLLLVANGTDSLFNSDWKKNYILDAANWAKKSPLIADQTLIANDPNIAYFGAKTPTDLVLRAINPGRVALTEKIDTFWLPGHVYAHRIRQGEAEEQLKADVLKGNGEILKHFKGRDKRSVYFFKVEQDVQRSHLLLERPT